MYSVQHISREKNISGCIWYGSHFFLYWNLYY